MKSLKPALPVLGAAIWLACVLPPLVRIPFVVALPREVGFIAKAIRESAEELSPAAHDAG